REALNERRNLPAANQSLRWILQGNHPGTGAHTRDRDQTDPVRMFSGTATLLKEKISPSRVTERLGFSNLLVWQLTGQGSGTREFLDQQPTMFFDSGNDCLRVFHDAHQRNMDLKEAYQQQHPEASNETAEAAIRKQPGYIPTHNSNAYGEAANSLGLTPSRKEGLPKWTLEEKLLPYFAVDLYWKAPKVEGRAGFYTEFGFYGLKSDGLTALQLANNLVFLGICEPPEPEAMAAWVSEKEDKDVLGFGVIFVEHALCKIQRWSQRYNTSMRQSSFERLANEIIHTPPWVPQKHECLPFPIAITIKEIEAAIQRAKV
ncbi:hypothetical protein B0H17DRAFT_1152853, partial [Mycena rosella]